MLPDAPSTAPRPEFWQGLAMGRFRLPHCERCDAWHPPGASRCGRCGGELDWREASGIGTVYSLMERHAPQPSDERHAPQPSGETTVFAIVALEVGPRMMVALRTAPDGLRVGDRVGPARPARPGRSAEPPGLPSEPPGRLAEPLEGLPEFVPLASE